MFLCRLDQLFARTAGENNEFHDATMLSNKKKVSFGRIAD